MVSDLSVVYSTFNWYKGSMFRCKPFCMNHLHKSCLAPTLLSWLPVCELSSPAMYNFILHDFLTNSFAHHVIVTSCRNYRITCVEWQNIHTRQSENLSVIFEVSWTTRTTVGPQCVSRKYKQKIKSN
jgi:hypothetical protein